MPSRRLAALVLVSIAALSVFVLVLFRSLTFPSNLSPASSKASSLQSKTKLERIFQEYLNLDLNRYHGAGDLYTVTCKIRLFKTLWEDRTSLDEQGQQLFKNLHDQLFGWALKKYHTLDDLYGSFKGKGVVMSLGSKYVRLAVHAIKIFRTLGCNLPFEIFYNGEEDLDHKSIDYLKTMKDVAVKDINNYFDVAELKLHGWDLKPFAMLASSFAEVLLIDADAVFVQNPLVLYDDPGYISSGSLFFYDRTMGGYTTANVTQWMNSFLPQPLSPKLRNSRLYTQVTNYEQESGVVLINKQKRFMGMLAACRMNCPAEKEELHKYTHGDKESFFLGFEMAQESYYFVPTLSGSIGRIKKSKEKKNQKLCGKLAHFDRHRRLLWFNDGIVADKGATKSEPTRYEHYGIEGSWDGLCLNGEYLPIEEESIAALHKIISDYERDPLEMKNDPQTGAAMYNLGLVR